MNYDLRLVMHKFCLLCNMSTGKLYICGSENEVLTTSVSRP